MADFIISFEKDKDYRRFHSTNVLANYHRKMMIVDFVEEVPAMMRKIIIPDDDESIVNNGESNIETIVQATAIIHPEQLPVIIRSLQNLYDQYLAEEFPGGDHQDGED